MQTLYVVDIVDIFSGDPATYHFVVVVVALAVVVVVVVIVVMVVHYHHGLFLSPLSA